MKQGQYEPMPLERQVVSLFAGTKGYLDEISLLDVRRFEEELLELMQLKHADILKTIAETKDLNDNLQKQLHEILKEFVRSFKMKRW